MNLRIIKDKLVNFTMSHAPSKIRIFVLKKANVISDSSIIIKKGATFENVGSVKIGTGCIINSGVNFYVEGDRSSMIIIGDNVSIAKNVTFDTGTHEIGSSQQRAGKALGKNITVGNGCWIGINTLVLSGVTIGEGCIIQAGSVVFKNCKPNCIYGGNPAKLITDLSKISALR